MHAAGAAFGLRACRTRLAARVTLLRPARAAPAAAARALRRPRRVAVAAAADAQQLDAAAATAAPPSAFALLGRVLGVQRAGPAASRVLTALLASPTVPIGTYVDEPRSVLHGLDPRVKQAWLLALLLLPGKLALAPKLGLAAALAGLSAACLPRRVWAPQLKMLGALCALLFVFAALGTDSVPPLTQPRLPGGALEALPSLRGAGGYSYVLFKLGPLQATRRGVALAASASALTFCLLQSAHLCLCTTTPEALAAGLSAALSPLRRCGAAGRAAADEAVLTLLLSVRFCALVFEHGRNLALGLAVRGIDWAALGAVGTADVVAALLGRLLAELFATAAQIADAMRARGYAGPAQAHAALEFAAPLRLRFGDLVATLLLAALLGAAACGVGCK